ncbi:MAG TPA: hypothetical protein VFW23_07870 [Tepidisphaeraceae bacterium]|nr:hypothetical protein [Tepidisphaeraceae bacterium]
MTWHALAIALGIVALSVAVADLHGLDRRFSRHGQAWQLACTDGLFRLGNASQIAIEAKQIQEAREARARDNDEREAETRNILRQAPWRSPTYEAALTKLKELKEGEAALAAKEEAEAAPSRSQPIDYAISPHRLILFTGALPVVWLIMMLLAVWRRLRHAGWRRREVTLFGTALGSALIILVLAGCWIRSRYARDEIRYEVQQPPEQYEYWIIRSEHGDISCSYLENKFMRNLSRLPPPPHFPGSEQYYAPQISKSWAYAHVAFHSHTSFRGPLVYRLGFSASANSWSQWNHFSNFTFPTLGRSMGVSVPIWILMLPFMIPCLMVMRLFRKRLREIQGRCQKCGYDLRASPARCPECGMVRAATTDVAC